MESQPRETKAVGNILGGAILDVVWGSILDVVSGSVFRVVRESVFRVIRGSIFLVLRGAVFLVAGHTKMRSEKTGNGRTILRRTTFYRHRWQKRSFQKK